MKTILILLTFFAYCPTLAQDPFATPEERRKVVMKYRESAEGIMSLKEFLLEKTVYPEIAVSKGIEGKTAIRFIVRPTEIQKVEILNKLDDSINQELLRMVELMPKQGLLASRGPYGDVRCTIYFNFEIKRRFFLKNRGTISIDFIEIVPLNDSFQ